MPSLYSFKIDTKLRGCLGFLFTLKTVTDFMQGMCTSTQTLNNLKVSDLRFISRKQQHLQFKVHYRVAFTPETHSLSSRTEGEQADEYCQGSARR